MARLYYPEIRRGTLAGGKDNGVDIGEASRKIAKLIPVEIVTAYAALVSASLIVKWETLRLPLVYICFFICWVLTPFYLNMVADPGKPKRNQLVVGALAFPIWAYLISGNQVVPQFYDPGLATILALLFSLITSLIPMNRS